MLGRDELAQFPQRAYRDVVMPALSCRSRGPLWLLDPPCLIAGFKTPVMIQQSTASGGEVVVFVLQGKSSRLRRMS